MKMNTVSVLLWAILAFATIYFITTEIITFLRRRIAMRRIAALSPNIVTLFRDSVVGIVSVGQKILERKEDNHHAIFVLRDEISVGLHEALVGLYSNREKAPQVGDTIKDEWLKCSSVMVMLLAIRFNYLGGKKINIFGLPSFREIQCLSNDLGLNIDGALEDDEIFISVCALLFERITKSIPDL